MKMKKRAPEKKAKRCWEFFHCLAQTHSECLMSEVEQWKCWTVNIACCRINKDAPRPLSIKGAVCKTCDYYKEYYKLA